MLKVHEQATAHGKRIFAQPLEHIGNCKYEIGHHEVCDEVVGDVMKGFLNSDEH